jgi:O-antigen ligase
MLASPPVHAAGLRVGPLVPALAAAAVACAVFFGGGDGDAPLVWIGAIAFVAAVLLLVRPPPLAPPSVLLLGSLFALAAWCGLSTIWSISPDASWTTTNRTLVYAVFALLGVIVATRRETLAAGAAVLLGALVAWALVVKCIPPLYGDYDRVARLRAPLEYWNELALLCAAGLPVALWLAAVRRRVEGVVLVYGLTVALLLTYSRFGVVLGFAAAVAWIVLDRRRVESLAAFVVGAVPAIGVFGIALALPGITQDGVARATRDRDGWIFALVLLAGAGMSAAAALALRDREVAPERRRQIERAAAVAAGVLVAAAVVASVVLGGRIWSDFTNPGGQLANDYARLGSVRSNRWTWWQEAWHAFTRHPGGGTGAGTFELTNKLLRHEPIEVDDPHNTPLRFLSETGIVGFLLFLGAAAGALWGAWRARRDAAGLALGIGVAAFFVHTVIDKDWNYVAACAPFLFVAGALASVPAGAPRTQRRLLAVAAAGVALAASYSLVAPWLGQRELANAATASGFQRAHSYDPLSVDAVLDWAAYEEGSGRLEKAASLYRQATSLEPENASTWYELGAFYYRLRLWRLAYDALNTSYTYDRFGRASIHCGLLDRARWNAGFRFGVRCPGEARASSP